MPRSARLVLPLVIVLCLAFAASAQAAITVTSANDSGTGSLREAVENSPAGETINLPAGTYTLTSEPLIIEKDLTISGHSSTDTTIRAGGGFNVITSFTLSPDSLQVNLNDVTIRDGDSESSGGGIFAFATVLTLRRDVITSNRVSENGGPGVAGGEAKGGGVAIFGGSLTLIESVVSANTTEANGGSGAAGGLASAGGISTLSAPLTIEGSTISGNRALALGGQGPSSSEQDGGEASGGGFFVYSNEPAPPQRIVDTTISGNLAEASAGPGGDSGEAGGGGGLIVATEVQYSLADSTITQNTARGLGTASEESVAGGLFAVAGPGTSIAITGDTIAANVVETTVTNAFGGGNLFAAGEPASITLGDTIIAGGAGPAGTENCFLAPGENSGVKSLGFNLDSSDQCGFHAAGDKINTDPQLGPLQANGGLTQTMLPGPTSPVIDQGSGFGLTKDQRGSTRPFVFAAIAKPSGGDGSDIGSVEVQPVTSFSLGKLQRNKKKGTVTLEVKFPGPAAGTITLAGKGIKKAKTSITKLPLKLTLRATGKAKKALLRKGSRKVAATVTYQSTIGSSTTLKRKTKLIKKKARKHRKK